jgi:hypothetical protein
MDVLILLQNTVILTLIYRIHPIGRSRSIKIT